MQSQTAKPVQRVLLVLQSTAIGGMETHAVDLAAEYTRRGLVVAAIVPEHTNFDPLAERFRLAGARTTRLDTDARAGRTAQFARLRLLVRECRGWRPDVVHLHTGGATGGFAVIALARLVSAAIVLSTEHDVPAPGPGSRRRVERYVMDRLSHALVAVSRRNASLRMQRLGARHRSFAVVLNGVPVPSCGPPEQGANRRCVRGQLGIDESTEVIGSVVRLAEGKGLEDLLRAFALLPSVPRCVLLLVGDGPMRSELERLARDLGIAGDVIFAGHQTEPAPFLDAMDIFALAVPAGSMSVALLEAMARGLTPVITFCGPEEAVIPDRTGLGAPPNDPQGLAAALACLVADPAMRSRLGLAAAAHVRRHFSVQRVADDLLDVYTVARSGHVPRGLRASAPPDAFPGFRGETTPIGEATH